MTQEEKSLLLQDFCARLSYGLKVKCGNTVTKEICELIGINAAISTVSIRDRWAKHYLENVASIKPYLRPMSSMTEEEKDTYDILTMCNASWVVDDWLNKNMFDYRGLIEKGLALVASEGMYDIKNK